MRRCLPLAAVVVAAAVSAPAAAAPVPVEVDVVDDDFLPPDVDPDLGIPVHWIANPDPTTHEHNVVQDKGLFKSGPPTDSLDFTLHASAGTFPYYCEVHGGPGGHGMSGKVRVAPDIGIKAKRGSINVRWSFGTNESGNQFDVQYRVQGHAKWKDWKRNTKQGSAQFGGNDKPIDVNPSKIYEVRARSEKASNPKKKHSGWSPKLVIEFT
jgi:plastocyanin